MLIWGMVTRVDFQRALVYSRCVKHAPCVTRTSWTGVAETLRRRLTFNFGTDVPENALNCLSAVIGDYGSKERI